MHEKINVIRKNISDNIGSKVRVTSKKSRKKILVRQGVIESTYPNIFVIRYDATPDNNEVRRVSYSYIDVLTHSVELALYRNKCC